MLPYFIRIKDSMKKLSIQNVNDYKTARMLCHDVIDAMQYRELATKRVATMNLRKIFGIPTDAKSTKDFGCWLRGCEICKQRPRTHATECGRIEACSECTIPNDKGQTFKCDCKDCKKEPKTKWKRITRCTNSTAYAITSDIINWLAMNDVQEFIDLGEAGMLKENRKRKYARKEPPKKKRKVEKNEELDGGDVDCKHIWMRFENASYYGETMHWMCKKCDGRVYNDPHKGLSPKEGNKDKKAKEKKKSTPVARVKMIQVLTDTESDTDDENQKSSPYARDWWMLSEYYHLDKMTLSEIAKEKGVSERKAMMKIEENPPLRIDYETGDPNDRPEDLLEAINKQIQEVWHTCHSDDEEDEEEEIIYDTLENNQTSGDKEKVEYFWSREFEDYWQMMNMYLGTSMLVKIDETMRMLVEIGKGNRSDRAKARLVSKSNRHEIRTMVSQR